MENIKKINEIRVAILEAQRSNLSPRGRKLLQSAFIIMCGIVIIYKFKSVSLVLPTLGVIIILAVLLLLATKWSTIPKTHTERIDKLLTNYAPIDREAFIALQEKAKSTGLNEEILEIWIEQEKMAIATKENKINQLEFTKRKL
jgi:hypothetical protein